MSERHLKPIGTEVLEEFRKDGDLDKALEKAVAHGMKRKFQPQDRDAMICQLKKDRELRARAQSQSLPFIDGSLFEDFRLVQGLYLLGAVSGQGKSTTAANILSAYADHCVKTGLKKKAYLLTNEELSDAALGRIACIQLNIPYNKYHKGRLSRTDHEAVEDQTINLLDHIYVANDPSYDMGTLEDVQAVLEYARESGDVGLVLLDYYQTVERSRENDEWPSFQVLKNLGSYLKDYGRRVDVPVIAFAQLKPNSEGYHMKERVENDRTVYNHAFAAVEIKPDFERGVTEFIIHKDRFGDVQGKSIEMKFERGKYIAVGGL